MKYLIILITFLSVTLSARAEDFTVLWEMDFSPVSNHVLVSDDGKYFYYNDKGFINFHDSETGARVNQIAQEKLLIKGSQDYYLNNDRIVLPFSLDSILIYNIATKQTEETIDLNYDIENPNIYLISLSPNKLFLSLYCSLEDGNHIIIVDLNQKRLFRDVKISGTIGQLFNTNDPNRMIVTTSDQFGTQLVELTLDETAPLGYRKNIIEEVDKEGEIRGQKYDADEDAFYYLSLSKENGYKLITLKIDTKKKIIKYENFILANEKYWFNDKNNIILFEHGTLRNLDEGKYIRLKQSGPTPHVVSSSEGLGTILIREHTSLLNHKLRRLDVIDFLTSVNTENPDNNILYPNPTTGNINLVVNNQHTDIFTYKLYNKQGQLIISDELGFLQVGSNTVNIQLPSISKGIYLLKIESVHEVYNFNLIME